LSALAKLRELGFIDASIDQMAKTFENSLKLSSAKIESVYKCFISKGFSEHETRQILIHTPSIFGKAISTLNKQLDLLQEIFGDRFVSVLLTNPRRLIQGYDKTLKRYNLLAHKGLTSQEMERAIFLPSPQFNRQYEKQ